MIVLRFRSVGWVAAVAAAALGCYLVTQRVAGERRQLAGVERDILRGVRETREMEIEIETRGRLSQLERWNSDVLALSAPSPRQYLHAELQLAALDGPARLPVDRAIAPPVATTRTVAYTRPVAPHAEAPAARRADAPAKEATPLLRHATLATAKDDRPSGRHVEAKPAPRAEVAAVEPPPLLRHATFVKAKDDRLAAHPLPALASADFAADLDAMAAKEAKKHRR